MQSSTRSSNSDTSVNDEKIQEKNESLEGKVFPMQAVAYDDDGFPIEETIGKDICHPWRYKGPALACVLLLTLGSNFAGSALSPLKSTLIKELKINNAQYGVISSASSLINAVLPIFSGIAIDYYGSSWGSMVSSIFIFIGAILGGVGASTKSYGLIVGGQIVMGFGSTTIETAQSKLYTHWFRGTAKGSMGVLALVYGLDIGIGRVYNVVGKATAVPIQISTGSWTWSFWVPAILCGVTVFINAAYIAFERRLPARHQIITGRMLSAENEKAGVKSPHGPGFKGALNKAWDVITLSIRLIPAAFWILPLTQLLQAGTVNAYTSNLADIIKVTRFSSTLTAGYTSAIGQIIPILLTPVIGFLFDLYGRRTAYISFTAALWVLVFGLLGFTSVHPLAPTILGSVALAFNSIPFIASIPLLVPSQASIGVAFGIWKCFNSAGSTIMDVSTGAIQDLTPTGENQYNTVIWFLIALKSVDVLFGAFYHILDRKFFASVLWMNEKQRAEMEATQTEQEAQAGLKKPIKIFTVMGLVAMTAMIATAYVLYIYYSM